MGGTVFRHRAGGLLPKSSPKRRSGSLSGARPVFRPSARRKRVLAVSAKKGTRARDEAGGYVPNPSLVGVVQASPSLTKLKTGWFGRVSALGPAVSGGTVAA